MSSRQHSQVKGIARLIPSLALGLVSLLAAGEAQAQVPLPTPTPNFTFTVIGGTSAALSPVVHNQIYRGLGTSGHPWSMAIDLASDPNYQAGKGIAINNNGGRVAYYAKSTNASGNLVDAIYTNNGGTGPSARKLIAQVGDPGIPGMVGFGQGISIAKDGTVAFVAKMQDGSQRIYTRKNTIDSPKLVADSKAGYTTGYTFAPGISMNDDGVVAFTARQQNGVVNVFKSVPDVISPTITPISFCTTTPTTQCPVVFQGPSISNKNSSNEEWISFSSTNGVFASDGSNLSPMINGNPAFVKGGYREANINNSGTVSAFVDLQPWGTPVTGGVGQVIMTSDSNQYNMVAGTYFENGAPAWWGHSDQSSNHFQSMGTNSLNDLGNVAFMANQSNPQDFQYQKGIFTGFETGLAPGTLDDKYRVIGIGDTLFGATVVDLAMDRESLSNDKEIAFWAKLKNSSGQYIEGVFRANPLGTSQFHPWLPNCLKPNVNSMSFCGVTSGNWYDPPTANGFDYKMDGDSLFTSILDLPSTFENPFTVSVGDIILGQFTNGDEINFSKYADLLGNLLIDGLGVKEFRVRTGDTIDPTNPLALPIKLAFNTETADFSLYALDPVYDNDVVEKVPEPATMMGLLSVGAFFVYSGQRRKQKKA